VSAKGGWQTRMNAVLKAYCHAVKQQSSTNVGKANS